MTLPAPPPPPGAWHVAALVARAGLRRWGHRARSHFAAVLRAGPRNTPSGARRATGRRSTAGPLLGIFFGLLFFYATVVNSATFLGNLADQLDACSLGRPGQVGVSQSTFAAALRTEEFLRLAQKDPTATRIAEVELESLAMYFRGEAALSSRTTGERQGLEALYMKTFGDKGSEGFFTSPRRHDFLWPSASLWPLPQNVPAMVRAVGLLMTWVFLTLVLMSLASQDVGKVGWTLEWLFTLPATGRALMLSQLVQVAILNPIGWILTFALGVSVLSSAGLGWTALVGALFLALTMNVMVAAVRLVVETWLRQRMPHARLKNFQAVAGILGTLGLMSLFILPHARAFPREFLERLLSASDWPLLAPPALAALLCKPGEALIGYGGLVVWALFAGAASVVVTARMVSGGLIYQATELVGTRGSSAAPKGVLPPFRGIVGKEIRMLLRDRTYLAQTLVVPILMVVFQLFVDPMILEGVGGDCRHAAALAFGVGAYVLAFGGVRVLASEGQGLWLLYTLPETLDRVLRRKALFWAFVSGAFALTILGATVIRQPLGDIAVSANVAMALAGVFIYSFIAAGIGVLATDPLENEPVPKIGASFLCLYLMLAGLYAYGIYATNLSQKTAQVVLCALVAVAIWQKVRERLPYLLDPTQAPPPRIGVSDGLIVAFAFYAVQGLLALALKATPGSGIPADQQVFACAVAGAIVTFGAVLIFSLRHQAPVPLPKPMGRFRTMLMGIAWGVVAVAFGIVYAAAAHSIPGLGMAGPEAMTVTEVRSVEAISIGLMMVFVAPIFEEYLYRGVLLRGMLATWKPWMAVVGSAAVFAISHPPVAVIPVFVLGLATAMSYRMTGRLTAPILTHMIYNATALAAWAGR